MPSKPRSTPHPPTHRFRPDLKPKSAQPSTRKAIAVLKAIGTPPGTSVTMASDFSSHPAITSAPTTIKSMAAAPRKWEFCRESGSAEITSRQLTPKSGH